MLALLPHEMIVANTDDMIMDFNVNLNSPVEVAIKPLNDKENNEIRKFEQPYFLVSATVNKYQPKQLSFIGGLVIADIPPKIDEDIQSSIDKDIQLSIDEIIEPKKKTVNLQILLKSDGN